MEEEEGDKQEEEDHRRQLMGNDGVLAFELLWAESLGRPTNAVWQLIAQWLKIESCLIDSFLRI